MAEIKVEHPLLKFLHSLLDNEEERKILSMIFKDYEEGKIIEKMINYSPSEKKND